MEQAVVDVIGFSRSFRHKTALDSVSFRALVAQPRPPYVIGVERHQGAAPSGGDFWFAPTAMFSTTCTVRS
jgi:hypothetical protein